MNNNQSPDRWRFVSRMRSPADENAFASAARMVHRRRRVRLMRFMAAETLAISVLILSVLAGISERFASESLTPIFRALPITAAVVVAVLPILFFGGSKRRGLFK
jgi:hypothetical protein